MNITLKTETLQGVAAKALKGAGNLSMLAITSAIGIELVGQDLVLTTTDNNTNLSVVMKNVISAPTADKFYACTNADLFCKLIAKQTTKTVILEVMDKCLQVEGDGVYNLPLIQDEEGTVARIAPIEVDGLTEVNVESKTLKKLLKYNKLAVSKLYDEPMFTGYCIDKDKVYTYNGTNACISEINLDSLQLLLPSKMVDLFDLFEDKTVKVVAVSDKIKLESDTIQITGTVLEGFADYPKEPLNNTVYSDQFVSSVVVNKDKLCGVLDRLSLFVSDNEQHGIQLNFSENGLLISNMDSNACESVPYVDGTTANLSAVYVDINDLKVIANAVSEDKLTIIYGNASAIGVAVGNMRFILSLLSDEEEVSAEDIESEEVEGAEITEDGSEEFDTESDSES